MSGGNYYVGLESINLRMNSGKVVAILGLSGADKSTLLRVITGLLKPTSGEIYYDGKPQVGVNGKMAMVFQNFAFPRKTVSENIALGINEHIDPKKKKMVAHVIDMIGLEGFEDVYPREISGGMEQRVGFARVIVSKPEILCMDEPFSALDALTSENLREEILDIWSNGNAGLSNIIVTHNINEAVYMADDIVILTSNPGSVRAIYHNTLSFSRDQNQLLFSKLSISYTTC
ncbi:MAG: ATP-binding cassette domain-containing protein [Nitrososphaeria archaeon]